MTCHFDLGTSPKNVKPEYLEQIFAGTKIFEGVKYEPDKHDKMTLGTMQMWGTRGFGWFVARIEHKSTPMPLNTMLESYYYGGLLSKATTVEAAKTVYTNLYKSVDDTTLFVVFGLSLHEKKHGKNTDVHALPPR